MLSFGIDETFWRQDASAIARGWTVPSAAKEARHLKIWRAIERHAANPTLVVNCDLLCHETGVPRRTLNHICHAFSGLSPIAYIKRGHMSLAHGMLRRGGLF